MVKATWKKWDRLQAKNTIQMFGFAFLLLFVWFLHENCTCGVDQKTLMTENFCAEQGTEEMQASFQPVYVTCPAPQGPVYIWVLPLV